MKKLLSIFVPLILVLLCVVHADYTIIKEYHFDHPDCLYTCSVDIKQYSGQYNVIHIYLTEHFVKIFLLYNPDYPQDRVTVEIFGWSKFRWQYIFNDKFYITIHYSGNETEIEFYNPIENDYLHVVYEFEKVDIIAIRGETHISTRESIPSPGDFWGWLGYLGYLLRRFLEFMLGALSSLGIIVNIVVQVISLLIFVFLVGLVGVLVFNPLHLGSYLNMWITLFKKGFDMLMILVNLIMKIIHLLADWIGHAIPG
jgi:hypothetical protein